MLYVTAVQLFAIEGTALLIDDGGLVLYDMATKEEKVLLESGITNSRTKARFSSDGRRVGTAVRGRLHLFDVDGSGEKRFDDVRMLGVLHWNGDYVYWSNENPGRVYRANVTTGVVDTIYKVPGDNRASLGLHFTRDASIAYSHVRFDLTGAKPPLHYVKHCSPGISPSGKYITRNQGGHTCVVIHYRDTLENCCPDNLMDEEYGNYGVNTCSHNPCVKNSFYDTVHVPGVWSAKFVTASHAGDNWMTARKGYSGEDTSYVINLERKEYYMVVRKGNLVDFWPGPLPTSDNPVIALDKTTLTFSSEQTDPQRVTVTNSGGGTLSDLTIEEDASWLTVEVQGSGNTQELVNYVTLDGLTGESYSTTVTVGGGSAANTKSYTVVLTTGTSIPAPTDFIADAVGGPVVKLTWTDNAAGETGYAIERSSDAEEWQEITVTDSNATTFRDTGRIDGVTYSYRIRTVKGTDYSDYAGPVSVDVPLYPVIIIASPNANEVWQIGNTAHIKWSARNCDNVDIIFSMNGGRTWSFRPTGDAIGSIKREDTLWGDISFAVPDEQTQECYVQVLDYNDPGFSAKVGPISIVPNTGVHNRMHAITTSLHFQGSVPILHRGKKAYTFTAPSGSVIGIYRIDGSHVTDIPVNGNQKAMSVVWDGRNNKGKLVVPGCYIARVMKR